MSITEFRELPFGLQIGLLLRDGVVLVSRSAGWSHRVLFSFHSYFVEAGWDQSGNLQFVRSFAHTEGLEPYLAQLDWRELAA